MEPVAGPNVQSSVTKSYQGRSCLRWGVAAGLVGLPVVGSVLIAPTIAYAGGSAVDHSPVVAASWMTGVGEGQPVEEFLSDGALVGAFLGAGYTFDDALVLAQSEGVPDVFRTKVKAGEFLAQGIALAGTPLADPSAADGYSSDDLRGLFLASGYSFEDAVVLAEQWGVDVGQAKVKAGSELKTVGVLPFVDPAPSYGGADVASARFDAFFAAGYGYDDAVLLADFWGLPRFVDAKLKAGAWLLAARSLPAMAGLGSES